MKTLKYFILTGLFIFGYGFSNAQDKKPKSNKMHRSYTKMNKKDSVDFQKRWAKELSLSDEQVEKIKSIRENKAQEMKGLKEKMKDIRTSERKEINEVYTAEQKEKIKTMREKRMEKMKKKGHRNRGDWGKRDKSRQ